MCLSIPAKIVSIKGNMAKVEIGGNIIDAGLQLIEDPQIGDYVLLHTGFAIQKISEEDANETKKLLNEILEIQNNML